jgi:hypothetical protein
LAVHARDLVSLAETPTRLSAAAHSACEAGQNPGGLAGVPRHQSEQAGFGAAREPGRCPRRCA